MGWTGIYDWDSTESNKDIIKREFFGSSESKWEDLKWSSKGNHVWILAKNKQTGFVSATVVLCKRDRKDHEFMYKSLDLTSGPCEMDMPKSWLELIDKSYFETNFSKDWIERFKRENDKPKEPKVELGSIYECYCAHDITWGNGHKIDANEQFFVKVEPHKTRTKTMKLFVIYNKRDYGYSRTNYRLCSDSFKNISKTLIAHD